MRVQNTKMLPCSFDRSIENRRKVNWIFIKPIKPLNFGFFLLKTHETSALAANRSRAIRRSNIINI